MILGCTKYGKPTDIWSLGCIIAELVMGQPMFPGILEIYKGSNIIDQLQKIF